MKYKLLVITEKNSIKKLLEKTLTELSVTDCAVCAINGYACTKEDAEILQLSGEAFQAAPLMENTQEEVRILGEHVNAVIEAIKEEISHGGYDYIVNACDPDKSGEYLFNFVFGKLKTKTPVARMRYKDLTESGLKQAYLKMIIAIE